ncbi:MAG: hypothetical protein COA79_01465 [Planctomycetota bacterium]|nr:MAG: hypothetical protein COA79_01465 [Planctomycetota bacterium]
MEEVLIIDDYEDITDAIASVIKYAFKDKYKVSIFNDSELALYYLKTNGPFKMIFLDLDMPKISGDTLIPMIKELYPNQKIKIITGKSDSQLEELINNKYPEYKLVRKPFQLYEIIEDLEDKSLVKPTKQKSESSIS